MAVPRDPAAPELPAPLTGADTPDAARRLRGATDRLTDRTATWTPARWASSCPGGGGARADVVYALVQHLADLAADAEGRPRREVPRLGHDVSLPDQLAVMATDLLAAADDPGTLAEAAESVREVARRI
ncbi:MAG TPA: hypothetical protein VGD72_03120 [Mycobacteriales bacterium]